MTRARNGGQDRNDWTGLRQDAGVAAVRRRREALRDARLEERIDLPVVLLALLLIAGAAFLGQTAARSEDGFGQFDPEVLRPAPDERILENLRDHEAPIIDATTVNDSRDRILIARRDGQMHFYDRATGLFSNERFDPGPDLAGTLAMIGNDCTRMSFSGPDSNCDSGDLFALTDAGGLARRAPLAGWQTVLSDVPWTGDTGKQVEQQELVAWAASASGRYILVLAGQQGAAILDQNGGVWRAIPNPGRLADIAPGDRVRLVVDGETFWIGSALGLARVAGSSPDSLDWHPNDALSVRDMTRAAGGRILAIIEAPCPNGQADCLSVSEVRGIRDLSVLVGENEINSNLSDATVAHAALQAGRVVTFGRGGISVYDPQGRRWRTLEHQTVTAVYAGAEGETVHAAVGNDVLRVSGAREADRWTASDGPFSQILVAPGGDVLALDAAGQVRDVRADRVLAWRDPGRPPDARFETGASIRSLSLVLGPSGALVHDASVRRFSWIPAGQLDPVLRAPGQRLFAVGEAFWLVSDRNVVEVSVDGDFPDHALAAVSIPQTQGLRGPFRSVSAAGNGLWIVDALGQPFNLSRSASGQVSRAAPIGAPRAQPGPVSTATASPTGLYFGGERAIWFYDIARRDWRGPVQPPEGGRLRDLAWSDALNVLMEDGRVLRLDDTWDTVFGRSDRAFLGRRDITDAMSSGGNLYLGGNGGVQRYSPGQSAFSPPVTGGSGDVRLISVRNGMPTWLSNNVLRRGGSAMTDKAVLGAWSTPGGTLAMARDGRGRMHSVFFPEGAERPVCTHFTADAPLGNPIDATVLPGDRVFVVTSGGAGIYVPSQRRWLAVQGVDSVSPDLRLHQAGGYLLAATRTRLRTIPISSIPVLDSCATPKITFGWATDTGTIRVVEVDDASGSVALLDATGRVGLWRSGSVIPVLPESEPGPGEGDLSRVLRLGPTLVFSAKEGIWSYNSNTRQWRRDAFAFGTTPGPRLSMVDIRATGTGQVAVTAWSNDGRSYGGVWQGAGNAPVLRPLSPVTLPVIAASPGEILDVSSFETVWAVARADGVEIGRRNASALRGTLDFPDDVGVQSMPFQMGQSHLFLSGSAVDPETLWFLPRDQDLEALRGSLEDATLSYQPSDDRGWLHASAENQLWRIDATGRVLSCEILAARSTDWGCETVASAPVAIDPAGLRAASEYRDTLYILLAERLFRLDEDLRNPIEIGAPVASHESTFFSHDGGLFLWEGPGRDVWRIDHEAGRMTPFLRDVERMAKSRNRLMTLAAGTLSIDGQPVTHRAASFDWASGGPVFGIDVDGSLIVGDGRVRALALPSDGSDVTQVIPDTYGISDEVRREGVWVERRRPNGGHSVNFHATSRCEVFPGSEQTDVCYHTLFQKNLPLPDGERLRGVPSASWTMLLSDTAQFDMAQVSAAQANAVQTEVERSASRTPGATGGWQPQSRVPWLSHFPRRDQTPQVADMLVPRGSLSEIAPPRIVTDALPTLDNGRGTILATGMTTPEPWSPLDIGWMRWEGEARRFSVATASGGRRSLSPTEMIVDGRFLPAHDGRASLGLPAGGAAVGTVGHALLNEHSLWHVAPSTAPRLVELRSGPLPSTLHKGSFVLPGGKTVDAATGSPSAAPPRTAISIDDLTLEDAVLPDRVTGTVRRRDGSTVTAFTERGFAHDIRQGVGWRDASAVLIGPAGLVSAEVLSGFDAGPTRPGALRRVLEASGATYLESNGTWYRDDPAAGWRAAQDPTQSRQVATNAGVEWRFSPSGFETRASDAQSDWRVTRRGLDFAADQLIALTSTTSEVLAITSLGTHSLASARSLSDPGAAVALAPSQGSGVRLDVSGSAPGATTAFASDRAGQVVATWRGLPVGWGPPSATDRPWSRRIAVDDGVFRVTLDRAAPPLVERVLDLTGGGARHGAFDWARGERMPFDDAVSLHGSGQALWIGTRFGLRQFDASGTPVPGQRTTIYDISLGGQASSAAQPAGPHDGIGRPAGAPGFLIATTPDGGCADLTSGAPAPCRRERSIAERMITDTALWRWTKADGTVSGSYRIGPSSALSISLGENVARFPHDVLQAAIRCGNEQVVEVWSGQDLTRHGPVRSGDIRPAGAGNVTALHCQLAPSAGDGITAIDAGLYALSTLEVLSDAGTAWTAVPSETGALVRTHARGGVPFDGARLRLTLSDGDLATEIRDADSPWRSVDWSGTLPAIDTTLALARSDVVGRLTPEGLLTYPQRDDLLRVDPDTVRFRRGPGRNDFRDCQVANIGRADGQRHELVANPDSPLIVRCTDGRVFQERPAATQDSEGFALTDMDPFAGNDLISVSDFWTWTREQADPVAPASMRVTFRGERLSLGSGRFAIDDYRALAAPFGSRVEVISANGWWRHAVGDLALPEAQRTDVIASPATVTGATRDRDWREDRTMLCLKADSGSLWIDADDRPNSVDACWIATGEDAIWHYRTDPEGGVSADASAFNGPTLSRRIAGGRFADTRVQGLPAWVESAEGGPTGNLLAPSDVGATAFGENGQVTGIVALPQPAFVLASRARAEGPVLLTSDGPRLSDGSPWDGCWDAGARDLGALTGRGLRKAEWGLGDSVRVFARAPGEQSGTSWITTIDCGATEIATYENGVQYAADQRHRHAAQLALAADLSSTLQVGLHLGEARIEDGVGRNIRVGLPTAEGGANVPVSVFARAQSREAVLVTGADVYLVDTDAALTRLARLPRSSPGIPDPLKQERDRPEDPVDGAVPNAEGPRPSPQDARPDLEPPAPTARDPTVDEPGEGAPSDTKALPRPLDVLPGPPSGAKSVEDESPAPIVDNPERLRIVQQALQERDLYRLRIDGFDGPGTRAGIEEFQRQLGQPATGILTRGQYRSLTGEEYEQ